MKTPEGKEKDKVKAYLKSIGAWYFLPYMAGFGRRGVPDIVACIRGTFWGIEVKRPGAQATLSQELTMNRINASGGCTAVGTADVVIAAIESWRAGEATAGERKSQLKPAPQPEAR